MDQAAPAHQAISRHQRERVKTQIWSAVATYVLIAIVRKELRLEASLYTCLHILSVSLFEKTKISCAHQPYLDNSAQINSVNQLMLFDF